MSKRKLPVIPEIEVLENADCLISDDVYNRFDPGYEVKNLEQGDNVISIYGEIGASLFGDGMTSRLVGSILRRVNGPVVVNINSPGGNFWEGLSIYNLLRNYEHDVTVNVVGMAASAAAIVMAAGDTVKMAQSAFVMIHNSQVAISGDRHVHQTAADTMESFDRAIADIFAARTGMRSKKLSDMMDEETWINGRDAVKMGFADNFLPADEVSQTTTNEVPKFIQAANKLDRTLAKANLSRSERRKLLQDYKSGKQDAVTLDTHNAVKNILEGALEEMKKIGN